MALYQFNTVKGSFCRPTFWLIISDAITDHHHLETATQNRPTFIQDEDIIEDCEHISLELHLH